MTGAAPLKPRTNFYVDGFNLYYRLLRSNPGLKWLDLDAWCRRLLPGAQLNRVRYFTALVDARPSDPDQPVRQQIYLRALRTLAAVTIHEGKYKTRKKRMWLTNPKPGGPSTVEVYSSEEKGSDVNLATMLLADGFAGDYDQAVVISDDSDLKLPIQVVTTQLHLPVGVLNPQQKGASDLRTVATFYRKLRVGPLRASQFATVLIDTVGTFSKPATWV